MVLPLLIFIIISVGVFIIRSLVREDRLTVITPAGSLLGVAFYIHLLNLTAKFLPGEGGIIISLIFFILVGLGLFVRYHRSNWTKLESLQFPIASIYLFIFLVVIIFSFIKMATTYPAGDSAVQWALAASFARGNHPLMSPWQPDVIPTYHLGAYFFEGSLLALSGLPLVTVHTLINTFFLASGSLLAIFMFWGRKYSLKNSWLLIASLTIYLAFGIVTTAFPNIGLLTSKSNLHGSLLSLPTFEGTLPRIDNSGGGLVDLNSLSYLPARSLSIGLALLLLYLTTVPWKNNTIKIVTFSLLLAALALIEESTFLPVYLVILSIFVISLTFSILKLEIPNFRYQKTILLKVLISTFVICILQGGFITSKLMATQENSTFILTLPSPESHFFDKLARFQNYNLLPQSPILWLIPNPILLTVLLLISSYWRKDRNLLFISLFSLICFLLFLTIEYPSASSNNIRFYNLGYIAVGFGFFYLIYLLSKNKSLKFNLFAFLILLPLLVLPTLIPETVRQIRVVREGLKNSQNQPTLLISFPSNPQESISLWARKHLPTNSRFIVLDREFPSPSGSLTFQNKGLYTIFSPLYIRSLRPEPGPEFFDLALTLNPSLFKQTKAEYIYIESESSAYQQLPQYRKMELEDSRYFEILQSIDLNDALGNKLFFRLYKVKAAYLYPTIGGKEIQEGTFEKLQRLIPKDSTVFVNDFPELSFWYRMALSLVLKDRSLALKFRDHPEPARGGPGGPVYMGIETSFNMIDDRKDDVYDFYILPPNKKPKYAAGLIWSNVFASAWKRY